MSLTPSQGSSLHPSGRKSNRGGQQNSRRSEERRTVECKEPELKCETAPLLGSMNDGQDMRSTNCSRTYTKKGIKHFLGGRLLKTKSVIQILIVWFLEIYAVYGVLGSTTHLLRVFETGWSSFIQAGLAYGFPALFFPVGGILADMFGRHRMSRICLLLLWISSVIFTLSVSVVTMFDNGIPVIVFKEVIPICTLLITSILHGIFQISWLTFGGDQLIDAPTSEVSSYIYWFYWVKNLGQSLGTLTFASLLVLNWLQVHWVLIPHIVPVLQPLVSVSILTGTIFLERWISDQFDAERNIKNPLTLICGVMKNSVTSRPKPPFISAYRYGEDPPSGLGFARVYHGGKYTDEEVEEVRTFWKMLAVLLSISGSLIVYSGLFSGLSNQIEACMCNQSIHCSPDEALTNFRKNLVVFIDNLTVTIAVPLWNYVVFPLMGYHYFPNTRKRMWVGHLLFAVSAISAVLVLLFAKSSANQQLVWLILPTIVMGLAETSLFIPVLEFIYAQSPDVTKGLLIGATYFLIGIWQVITGLFFNVHQPSQDQNFCPAYPRMTYTMWYFVGIAAISLVGLVLYSPVVCLYKNRKRNNPITDLLRISMYY